MNHLKLRTSIIILSTLFTLQSCVTLPETGQKKLMLTSQAQEIQMGDQGYQEVLQTAKIIKTEPAYSILQDVGSRIASQANQPDFQWEYNLIDENQMNAWCMPGGKIAVYTGILSFMKNEAGMAAVIGHEVAHATLRHAGQRISQQFGLSAILGIVSGGLQNSKNHDAVLSAMGVGSNLFVAMPFSRKHETESDLVGLNYMAKAGYDPREAIAFWQRFAQATAGSAPPEFMSTHPGAETRIQDLTDNMAEAMKLYNQASVRYGLGRELPKFVFEQPTQNNPK